MREARYAPQTSASSTHTSPESQSRVNVLSGVGCVFRGWRWRVEAQTPPVAQGGVHAGVLVAVASSRKIVRRQGQLHVVQLPARIRLVTLRDTHTQTRDLTSWFQV